LYRLALYHCYLGQMIAVGAPERVTSRQLAEDLGVKDETVRRDVSFVGDIGRPGAGYDPQVLFREVSAFLGLVGEYPIIMVGTLQMLSALRVVFPAESFGVKATVCFSENEADDGVQFDELTIRHISHIKDMQPGLTPDVALVACAPEVLVDVIDQFHEVGVRGVLLLTAAIHVQRPEGMTINQIRMPCDIKALACTCRLPRTEAAD